MCQKETKDSARAMQKCPLRVFGSRSDIGSRTGGRTWRALFGGVPQISGGEYARYHQERAGEEEWHEHARENSERIERGGQLREYPENDASGKNSHDPC